jgi:hypothetical protein
MEKLSQLWKGRAVEDDLATALERKGSKGCSAGRGEWSCEV